MPEVNHSVGLPRLAPLENPRGPLPQLCPNVRLRHLINNLTVLANSCPFAPLDGLAEAVKHPETVVALTSFSLKPCCNQRHKTRDVARTRSN